MFRVSRSLNRIWVWGSGCEVVCRIDGEGGGGTDSDLRLVLLARIDNDQVPTKGGLTRHIQ